MIKRISLFLTGLFLLLFSSLGYSQKCLSSVKRTEILASNPALKKNIAENEVLTQKWIKENRQYSHNRDVVTVPVVVHVLWKTNSENISDEQIFSQLEVINNDFRKENNNLSATPSSFLPLAADIEIEFCLAKRDPNGNQTTGITRTQTTIDDIGRTEYYYQSLEGGHNSWNVNNYINIWICDLGEEGFLGFAFPPGVANPIESDGMVVDSRFFGTTGTAANSQPNHLGRTATHELGHYFNLEHLWGPGNGGCSQDDYINDTPSQYESSYGCYTFPFYDDCTPSGSGIMFNNYLDYSDDACMTMFTEGQKLRMQAALNDPRSSLLESEACNPVGTIDNEFQEDIIFYPNPASSLLYYKNEWTGKTITYHIYDIHGKIQLVFSANNGDVIDISKLQSGVYYLSAINNHQQVKKVVVY